MTATVPKERSSPAAPPNGPPTATCAAAPEPNPAARAAPRRPGQAHSGGKGRPNAAHLSISAQQEMQVLGVLRASLETHHEALEDPDLMLVLAEGETSLLEVLDRMLEADLDDDALIDGLKRSKDTLAARLHRLEERRKSRRVILEQALILLERRNLERPVATIALSERPPSLVVEEEAQIPARFFDLRPVLNRRLTKEALDAGEDVPGARLSNGMITLTVRRR